MDEKEKKEAVNEFIELTAKHTLQFFRLMGFESHIEATVLDESTNDVYVFTFVKLQDKCQAEKEK